MSDWMAHVEMTDPLRRYIGVHLGRETMDVTGRGFEAVTFDHPTVKRIPENEPAPAGLELEVAQGLALMQALNAYYGGIEDARSLRKDYDAERKRVDGLIDVVSKVVFGTIR